MSWIQDAHEDEKEESAGPLPLRVGKYRHFKGKEYEIVDFARHSETLEQMVVYRALYGEFGLWVRPADMFSELVEYEGRKVLRFTPID